MMRTGHRGRRRTGPAGAGSAATVPAVLAAVLAAVLLAGCAAAPPAASGNVTVPTPEPPTHLASPSGTPATVPPPDPACSNGVPVLASVPAMSPMPAPRHMPATSTMAAIQQRGYLLAGVDQDEYEWGYPNPDPPKNNPGKDYLGFDIDVLHALAHAIFGDADAIRFVPVTQDFRLGAAYEGLVDVVADSITINCPRKQQVQFSIDYFDSYEELLVPVQNTTIKTQLASGVPHIIGLAGKKVCTVGDTTSVQNLAALAKADGFSIVLAENWSDCLVMLQQGTVQAFSTDASILNGIAAEDPYVTVVGAPFSNEPHGLAFPPSDPHSSNNTAFVSFANGVLLGLESRTGGYCPELRAAGDASCWAAMYRTWIDKQLAPDQVPAPPPPQFIR